MDGDPIASRPRPDRVSRLFPAVRLLRSAGIALEARKLILAALGLVVSGAGWYGLDRLFGPRGEAVAPFAPASMIEAVPRPLDATGGLPAAAAEPFLVLVSPFVRVFSTGQGLPAFARAVLAATWGVLVWGLLGGAIARIAAVQQATGERIGIATALRFAASRAVGLIGAPLCPLIGLGFFAALCAPIGLLYLIPGEVGATIAGALAFLPLMAGLVMALILAGMAAGWPLMIATVAVEGEDAFDALSRSYSYVYQRPALYAFYALISWLIGAVGLVAVRLFAALVVHMARWGLSFGGPDDRIAAFFRGGAKLGEAPLAAHGFWIYVVRLLAHGWIYSYFFTAATMIYLLLRRDVDGASFDDLGGTGAEDEPFAPEPEAS